LCFIEYLHVVLEAIRDLAQRVVTCLVHFEDRPLPLWSVWPDCCQQPCPSLALELYNDAAHIARIWDPQKDLSLYDIEVRVVRMRMLEADRDEHRNEIERFVSLDAGGLRRVV
jgi:hypothetical protein